MSKSIVEPQRTIPVLCEAEVAVAGGGISGVAAAVAAARVGASTVLVERAGYLGGVATAGLMHSMGNRLVAGGDWQVVKGIAEEVLDRLAQRAGATPFWRASSVPCIPFDEQAFRIVLIEMLQESGVEVLLEAWVAQVVQEGEAIRGLIVESKGGRQAVLCGAAVDATGDADLAAFAGAPCRRETPDSSSLLFIMSHVDVDRVVAYFEQHPEEWQQYCDGVTTLQDFLVNWRQRGNFHLPHFGGKKMRLVQEAIARGEYKARQGLCEDLDVFGMFGYRGTDQVLINSLQSYVDDLDPIQHSRAELEARRVIPDIARFLQRFMPGFEHARIADTAATTGVRFTRWIDAGFDLTEQDRAQGARFDDTVGLCSAIAFDPRGGTFKPPRAHDFPYRIMLPQKAENLVVASGKSVSTAPRGILRGQACCYVLGQAGGVAAALAARGHTAPRRLPIRDLQKALLAQNVYLGPQQRLTELGLL